MCPRRTGPRLRLSDDVVTLIAGSGALVGFLLGVVVLGAAASATTPILDEIFARLLRGDGSALGLGWLVTYALANGSVVAALGVSLFAADLLSTQQLFLVVVGSRLGSAAVVVLVGALDYWRGEPSSVRDAVSLGLLTFLLTHAVYLPVTVVGLLGVTPVQNVGAGVGGWPSQRAPLTVFAPMTEALTAALGAGPTFLVAVGLVFGSLRLFDRTLSRVESGRLRRRLVPYLENPWMGFASGLLVTGTTTSVAFSLGVLVPVYNRGYLKRDEILPYVLGANVGTLFDTLLVALVLDTGPGVAVVLEIGALATLVSLVALLGFERFSRLVGRAHDRLVTDRQLFLLFGLLLVLVPVGLLAVSVLLGAG